MATSTRASSFLPTIKCSSCAMDIEIAMMGEHVCGGTAPASEPTPPPDSTSKFERMPYHQPYSHGPAFLKPGRVMPPKVDTSAANRPFFPQDQLTPANSASPSRSASPLSANDRLRSPFGRPSRNLSPNPRPLSPDQLSSNLDSAFPRFPSPRPGKQKPQQKSAWGSLSPKDSHAYQADTRYAPPSPKSASNSVLLQKADAIAPSRVEVNRGKAATPELERVPEPNVVVSTSASSPPANMPKAQPSYTEEPVAYGHTRTATNQSSNNFPVPRKNGYGGLGTATEDDYQQPLRQETRSQTFPRRKESLDFSRRNPSISSNASISQRSSDRGRKKSVSGPDLSRPLPPRGASLIRGSSGRRAGDVPPLPNINLEAEFGANNPYHTPTGSQSSNHSDFSQHSRTSSRSSPPSSKNDHSRKLSAGVTRMSDLMSEINSSMANLGTHSRSTSDLESVKEQDPYSPILSGFPIPRQAPPPAIPAARLTPQPRVPSPAPLSALNREPSPAPLQPPPRHPSPALLSQRSHTAPILPSTRSPTYAPSRPTTSKGNCKACTLPIKGKSISSADGRLTGRYHKPCFVCTTCRAPFPSSEFYVLDDKPYCERHYHSLNGSLCTVCDGGIEGQYLEGEAEGEKFHMDCLKCGDCGRGLKGGYWEVGGGVFCERDAWKRAQVGRAAGAGASKLGLAPTSKMERRTTRLMMM
ncbi:lim domain-containing protein [Rutstroemia sp. NJR-2017a BBW]|nr:lim domain-containing protein [Rutstroemia sp. NJR-2017a BBW]